MIRFLYIVFGREELISGIGTQFTSLEFDIFLHRSSVYYLQANEDIE